jgi:hypothetical protein
VKGTDAKETCNRINSKLAIVDREYVNNELSHKLESLRPFKDNYFIGFESIQDWPDKEGKQINSSMWAKGFPKHYASSLTHAVLLTSSAKLNNFLLSKKFDGAVCQKHECKHLYIIAYRFDQ